jgi:hypothetical protein
MKNYRICFFILIFFFLSGTLKAQKKITIDKGEISFTSNAPLEVIKASSGQMRAVIDPVTNQFIFSVNVSSFNGFNSGLQKEHFNEKYMESDIYPTATFKGKIIEKIDFSKDGVYEVRAKGDLLMHGQAQTRIIKSIVTINKNIMSISTAFTVPLADHNITVPKLISEKIATEIEVSIHATAAL